MCTRTANGSRVPAALAAFPFAVGAGVALAIIAAGGVSGGADAALAPANAPHSAVDNEQRRAREMDHRPRMKPSNSGSGSAPC